MKPNLDNVYLLANLEPTLVLDSECMSNAHGRASTNGTCAGMKNVALRRRQMPEFYQSEHPYLGLVKSYLQPSSQRIHDLHLTTCLCEQMYHFTSDAWTQREMQARSQILQILWVELWGCKWGSLHSNYICSKYPTNGLSAPRLPEGCRMCCLKAKLFSESENLRVHNFDLIEVLSQFSAAHQESQSRPECQDIIFLISLSWWRLAVTESWQWPFYPSVIVVKLQKHTSKKMWWRTPVSFAVWGLPKP